MLNSSNSIGLNKKKLIAVKAAGAYVVPSIMAISEVNPLESFIPVKLVLAVKVAKMRNEKSARRATIASGGSRTRRGLVMGLLLSLLCLVIFLVYSGRLTERQLFDSQEITRRSSSSGEKSLDTQNDGAIRAQQTPTQEAKLNDKSRNLNLLGPGEFAALIMAIKGESELLRQKALNQIKNLARVELNLNSLRVELSGIDSTDETFALIVAALGNVGTPQIQSLLREIVESRENDWRTFAAVVPVLGLLQSPTSETIDFLSLKAKHPDSDFASTSALALGSIVHTLSHTDSRRGELILQSYIERANATNPNIEELKDCIAVLGNAGLPATEVVLLELIGHFRADVRAEAVMALRFIRTQTAEDALLLRLDIERDLEVRLRVVDALTHGPVSENVVKKGMQILSNKKSTSPELREKLLDLFLHIEIDSEKKRALAHWLTQYTRDEEDFHVRSKAALTIKEMLTER